MTSSHRELAHADLVVVGAGVVGLGAAYAGLKRGLRVVVLDRATAVAGASVRNFGHVGVTGQAGEARDYALAARELWLELAERAGFWAQARGAAVVARTDAEYAVLAGLAETRDPDAVRLLTAAGVRELAPVTDPRLVGGALLTADLQVDPREAAPTIAAWLAAHGVEFHWRTAALAVETGAVHTPRGVIRGDAVVVAVNFDLDHLMPELAEQAGVQRCALDMLAVSVPDGASVAVPVLTGSSMLRYAGFAGVPGLDAVRDHLDAVDPRIRALDVNHMLTQRPDGTLLVGDTHARAVTVSPFQQEHANETLLELTRDLLGDGLVVRERWQGVYATGPREFLRATPDDGVRVAVVTTGIGMTTGLGLAESVVAELVDSIPDRVRTAAHAATV